MKKSFTHYLRHVFMLAAMLCVPMAAWPQSISSEATCEETPSAAPMLKAPTVRAIHLSGDVNCNGVVDINDVTALINTVLTGNRVPNGDVTGNGAIDINDVTELISMVLTGVPQYSVASGLEALDDIYRSMRTPGWSTTGNTHQCFGITAYNLMAEVMGDDMIMGAQGSGWFWFDATYNVKSRYVYTSWRSYDLWNAYYTWIANANYILAAAQSMSGTDLEKNYIKGQAYAIRAYSYFMLAQSFARTYKHHEDEPCVPLFTGTYFTGSTGQSRSTVAQVYAQIDADILQAVNLLNGTTQQDPSHIGYAVAQGLQSRIFLVEEKWNNAYIAARNAITASEAEGKGIQEVSDFTGLNDATAGNVMWGAVIPDEESSQYASLFAHMDASGSITTYAQRAPKQITTWLYDKMSATDARRAWWDPSSSYSTGGYVTQKFKMREGVMGAGDYIYMRVEEMYLNAAEALAHRGGMDSNARTLLNQFMAKRDPNYNCTKSGNTLGDLTNEETGSLLEEILIQRRLELWGEDGRIYTIRRLDQGFERSEEDGWPVSLQLTGKALDYPDSYAWVLTIPASEFEGNPNMNPDFLPVGDQNPLGDITGESQNLSFEEATSSMTTARTSFVYRIRLNRRSTVGEYITSVKLTTATSENLSVGTVTFPDGVDYTDVIIDCDNLSLGQTYSGTVTLSEYDEACHTGGSHISSHSFTINCQNGNPDGQKISFLSESIVKSVSTTYTSLAVTLTREVTEGEYTATLIMSESEGVSEFNKSVYFADGANTATTWLYFNDMEIGNTYGCVLTLSPEDVATGGAITSTRVTVNYNNWTTLGWGYYESGLSGQSLQVRFQQIEGTNTYRMQQLYDADYDIEFVINTNNDLYIAPQPCFYHSSYGVIWMMGYANQDNSGYAGMYDPDTKTAELQVRYYCDEGAFPVQLESLRMP